VTIPTVRMELRKVLRIPRRTAPMISSLFELA
jgi:hypothetical protein